MASISFDLTLGGRSLRHMCLFFLNILQCGFNYKTGVEIAELLSTSEAAITHARQGTRDVAGLPEAVLELLFPSCSGIAFEAQLMEHNLRAAHAEMEFARRTKGTIPERLSEALFVSASEATNHQHCDHRPEVDAAAPNAGRNLQ